MAGLTWLHLSDWHQRGADAYNRGVVRDALVQDIAEREAIDPALAELDFVVFSGDLSYAGQADELEAAREQLLDPLLEITGLRHDRVFLVPGNHDLDRLEFKLLPAALRRPLETEAAAQEWLVGERERERVLAPFSAFEAFATRYAELSRASWASSRRFDVAGVGVALLGLNSALMCGREDDDYGRLLVGEPQVLEALAAAEQADIRIAVVHHPLEWLKDFDRPRVQDELGRSCHFLLHGHEHEQRIQVQHGTQGDHVRIPGGASYDRRTTEHPRYVNAYNFVRLDIRRGEATVHLRRWSDRHRRWTPDWESVSDGRFTFALPKALGARSADRRFSGTLRPMMRVPFAGPERNRNFVGREDLLARLGEGGDAPLVHAITGLGGAGKTQLAAEYAHRRRADYRLVWWVRASTEATMLEDLAALAVIVGVSSSLEPDKGAAAHEVRDWLEANPGWLLVFDDVEHPDRLRGWLPQGGHVVITSRHAAWRDRASPIPIAPWRRRESISFLSRRTGHHDAAGADRLADALGDLPLALEQAAAYVEEHGTPFDRYTDLFESGTASITLAGTFRVALERIRSVSPAAPLLLELCAFLGPDAIPEDLLRPGSRFLPRGVRSLAERDFEDAMGALVCHSLVQRRTGTLSVHVLVQQTVADGLARRDRRDRVRACLLLLADAFPAAELLHGELFRQIAPVIDGRTLARCARLLPHALAVAHHAAVLKCEPHATSALLDRVGTYLRGHADFASARTCFERALSIDEAAGAEDRDLSRDLRSLGWVLKDLGELDEAAARFRSALDIDTEAERRREMARDLHGLGWALKDLGDLHVAADSFGQALRIDEQLADRRAVVDDLRSLGWTVKDLGDVAGARDRFAQALQIDEAAGDHEGVIDDLRSLGWALKDLDRLDEAQATFERALTLRTSDAGDEDSDSWRELAGLGWVLEDLGDRESARQAFERAVGLAERRYGPEHPFVARCLSDLAFFLRRSEDPSASPTFDRALAMYTSTLGPRHPTVITRRHDWDLLG